MPQTTTYYRDLPQLQPSPASAPRTQTVSDPFDLTQKQSASTTKMPFTNGSLAMQRMTKSTQRMAIRTDKKPTKSLMGLPAEVRTIILDQVFAQAELTATSEATPTQRHMRLIYTTSNRDLLRVCRLLRVEALPILLRSTTFVFGGYMPSPNLSQVVPKVVLEAITRVKDCDKSLLEAPLSDLSAFPRLEEVAILRMDSLFGVAKACEVDIRKLRRGIGGKSIEFDEKKLMEKRIKDNMAGRFKELHKLPEKVTVVGRVVFHAPYPNEVAWLDLDMNWLRKRSDCNPEAPCADGLCRVHRSWELKRQLESEGGLEEEVVPGAAWQDCQA